MEQEFLFGDPGTLWGKIFRGCLAQECLSVTHPAGWALGASRDTAMGVGDFEEAATLLSAGPWS